MHSEQVAHYEFLLVDDDNIFRKRLHLALTDRGYTALDAASVDAALALLTSATVSKVVLDLSMPEKDGFSLLSALASRLDSMQVVVLTGYGSIATATRAIKMGATQYLTKPTGIDEILAAFTDVSAASTENNTVEERLPSLTQVEWDYLQRVLQRCDGNITQAAKLLGMHRRSLQRKLQKSPGPLA